MMRVSITFALSVGLCIACASIANASTGSGSVTFWEESPGVEAEAHTFAAPTNSVPSDQTGGSFIPTSSTSSPDSYDAATYTPTDPPEADEFSAGYLDVPNPCVRRKFGGNYCDPPAPSPNNPDPNNRGPREQGPPPPSPEEIARLAIDRAVALAPAPQLEVAPNRIGLTGLESYFWLADAPETITATAGVPGLTVVARAVPAQFVWDFGDGSDHVTNDPGSRWTGDGGGISHMYETKGRYGLSVDVVWEASYSVNGGTWTPIGFFSTSDARTYPVREMIAVLTEGETESE